MPFEMCENCEMCVHIHVCKECLERGYMCLQCRPFVPNECPKCLLRKRTCLDCLEIEEAMELYPESVNSRVVKMWLYEARITEERYYDSAQKFIRDVDDRVVPRSERKRVKNRRFSRSVKI